MINQLFKYINESPTAYHAVKNATDILEAEGFTRLDEGEDWALEEGKGYYITRSLSSLIAFRAHSGPFMITAAHGDSPCFRIKQHPYIKKEGCITLNTERYGGMILSGWLDRPLSAAGQALFRTADGITAKLFDIRREIAVIPSLAIHLNREVNEGYKYNAQKDMLPLFSSDGEESGLNALICEACGEKESALISCDAFLYNRQPACIFGKKGEFIGAPRLDDLESAYIALRSFIDAAPAENTPVYCLFDNEEVGSGTRQGADSSFLWDTLSRLKGNYSQKLASGMLISIDNAHAFHPNYPEKYDPADRVFLNGGVALKHSANRKYTTDALSDALFSEIAKKAGARVQHFSNRSDVPGGSTLGSISGTHVSICSADIGFPQLAMHSAFETAGVSDVEDMSKAVKAFYQTVLIRKTDGQYCIMSR